MNRNAIIESIIPVMKKNAEYLRLAYIFGSTLRDDAPAGGDVDVAIYLKQDEDVLSKKMHMYAELSRALHRNDIDIVVLNTARNLVLIDDIIRNGKLIYEEDPDFRMEYEVKMLHSAIDFMTQRRIATEKYWNA